MKKLLLSTFAVVALCNVASAQFSEFADNPAASQFTLSSENNTLQIGGRVSAYYETRFLKNDTNYQKKTHNGWDFKDIDLDILGKTANKFVYEVHMSLIDLAAAAATQNTANPANPGIKAAYLQYKGWPVHIKFGYDKVPYAQGSMSEIWGTPFWSHANLFGGDLFSRRDLGLTLNYRFMKDRINLYGGAYTGMGENFFQYGNDGSGRFEYIGRAEFSYPAKMKYHIIDQENSPTPVFRVAVNARYADKTQPKGYSIYADAPSAPGAYGIRIIDGKRTAYGCDAIVKYKGISATFEAHMIQLKPTLATDGLYNNTTTSKNNNVVNAGGFNTGINYNWEKKHSVFSVMYEELNTNDLYVGLQDWLYLAYAYKFSGFNSVAKIEYYIPTTEDKVQNPLHYTGQLRVGYQVVF